jgi:hypothetical protein
MIGSKTVSDFQPTEELRIVHRKDFDFALLQQYQRIGGEFVQDAFSAYEEPVPTMTSWAMATSS